MYILINILGFLSFILGALLVLVGFNVALWGSALGNRGAIPSGTIMCFVGFVSLFISKWLASLL